VNQSLWQNPAIWHPSSWSSDKS